MLDGVGELNRMQPRAFGDPEIETRIAQYEMAFRMQTSRAGADRPLEASRSTSCDLYGPDVRKPGTLRRATACWPAGWSSAACASSSSSIAAGTSTATCRSRSRAQCQDVDQPSAALVTDLKQRGLLDDTLVIWGGEFGRTVYSQGR